jgi:hypothetical protein
MNRPDWNKESSGPTDEIRRLERKLAAIRVKQEEFEAWERSRRPIKIGFAIVIPLVLIVEGVHFYLTLNRTEGSGKAPWLMMATAACLGGLSWWYYRQAKSQRHKVFTGRSRIMQMADSIERRLGEIRRVDGVTGTGPSVPSYHQQPENTKSFPGR